MRRYLFAALTLLLLGALVASCSSEPAPSTQGAAMAPTGVDDPEALGEQLVRQWLDMLHGPDSDLEEMGRFLAPNFQIQRDDGSRTNREQYLAEPATVNAYEIRDLLAEVVSDEQGASLTVTFELAVDVIISGERHETTAPRIGTFIWRDDHWTLLSWGNFGTLPDDAPKN